MESCYKLTLEDSRDRVPLPRFGGDDRERPADAVAAEALDSLQGALHDPRRWGLSSEAIGTLGERLYAFWQRFRGCFKTCTRDTSGRAYDYLRGQLTMDGERNFANMARNMTGDDGQALQHFMSNSPWAGQAVFGQIQAEIKATAALAQGSTLILDESADEKAGTHNAGASRQYNGRLGKVDLCRVDTCLTYANGGLWAVGDGELFLPGEWVGGGFAQTRPALGIPPGRAVRTKIALGLEMGQPVQAQGGALGPLAGATTERGRLAADFAVQRVWTVAVGQRPRAEWLVIRRDAAGDCSYTLLNAPEDAPHERLIAWSCRRYFIERTFEDAKTEIGWDEFQAQKYRAGEHHLALTAASLWFVAQTKMAWAQAYPREPGLARQLAVEVLPALSTANVRELLKAVFPLPQLTLEQVTDLVIMHLVKRARSTSSRLKSQVKPPDSS